MTELEARIIAASAIFTHHTEAGARAGEYLATLLAERVAAAVREVWSQATEVTVDSDHNLHHVYAGEEKLADDWHDQFEDVAEQVRDDLIHLGETGHYADDNRVVRFSGAGS